MTLGFKQEINGKPTYFPEKILKGLWANKLLDNDIVIYEKALADRFPARLNISLIEVTPKITTIRADEHNRWKAGNLIHPVINNRTQERFQFAQVMNCVSVQAIEIKRTFIEAGVNEVTVLIDGKKLHHSRWNELAVNDGFEMSAAFFAYFNADFTGKIIHWTHLKY